MSRLTLTLRRPTSVCLDLSPLIPERLSGLGANRIKALRITAGKRQSSVGELFDVRGRGSEHIIISGKSDRCIGIGFGMSIGVIEVKGHGGHYLGQQMSGGRITVLGDCGDWAACGMTGGNIRIHGNAGDFLGAPLPGDTGGMSNGMIFIGGHAGDRAGDRMRSGMILVQGDAGDYTGSGMKAGTIIVLGATGRHTGTDMRRGSIVLARKPRHLPATFASCGKLKMEFLRLLFKELASIEKGFRFFSLFGPEAQRYAGDHAASGKGEILVLLNAAYSLQAGR